MASEGEGDPQRASPESLPARIKVAAVAGYVTTLAIVTQVPRLWGDETLWEHARTVAAAAAVLWFGGMTLLAPRLRGAPRSRRVSTVAGGQAVRRVRLQVLWFVCRALLGLCMLALIPLMLVLGPQAEAADQHLIDTASRVAATVVEVRPDPLSRFPSNTIFVDVGGRTVELALSYPGDERARLGDTVQVVVSPDDPDHVLPVDAHDDWAYTRAGSIVLVGGISVLILVVGLALLAVPGPRDLRRAWRSTARTATVIDDVARGDATIIEIDGARWIWTGGDWRPTAGGTVIALGDPGHGALVILDDGHRPHWPTAGLRDAG